MVELQLLLLDELLLLLLLLLVDSPGVFVLEQDELLDQSPKGLQPVVAYQ